MQQSTEITPSEVSTDLLQVEEEDLYLCEAYLKTYADTVTNENGEIEDILIYIAVPSDVPLPQDSRYRVIVKDNFGNPRHIVTNNNSVSLSAAGLFPDQIDSPLTWQVIIEYLAAPGGDLFLAFCSGEQLHKYDFEVLEESQLSTTPTSTSAKVSPTATTPHRADDTSGPKVSGANAAPNPTLTTFPVTISATISDGSGVASATLYFKTGKGAYQSAGQMSPGGGGVYSLTIGPLTPAGTYSFRILTVDNLGNPNCSTGNLDACPGGSFVVNIP